MDWKKEIETILKKKYSFDNIKVIKRYNKATFILVFELKTFLFDVERFNLRNELFLINHVDYSIGKEVDFIATYKANLESVANYIYEKFLDYNIVRINELMLQDIDSINL